MTRTSMSAQDALWLTMDRPNSLMVIDSVMWFRDVPDWDAVRQVIAERLLARYPVFARRAVPTGEGWAWEVDPTFRLDDHVIEVTLPDPADVPTLQAFVAAQRSVALDKAKPLWTIHLVDGLTFDDGVRGAAVLARFHHAIADGIRLTQVAFGLCDLEEPPAPVGRRLRRSTRPADVAASATRNLGEAAADFAGSVVGSASVGLAEALGNAGSATNGDLSERVGAVLGTGLRMFRSAREAVAHPERITDLARVVSSPGNRVVNDVASVGKLVLAGPSVRTVWSGTPGVAKGASWAPPLSLEQVKAVGRATDSTVNDVLLAAVAGAMTRYLREREDHSVDELLWMVPINVKPFDENLTRDLGNHFALVAFRMPIGLDDVRERLAEVTERMDRIKNSDEALITYSIQREIARAPMPVAKALTNYFANKAVGVLTNVPGPQQPMSLAGTEVAGVLGWAPCSGDEPMTVCIVSYNGSVGVGFGTDATLVADGDRLGQHFADEFSQMAREVLAEVP